MEEGHVDWGEVQRAQVEQMGMRITWLISLNSPPNL